MMAWRGVSGDKGFACPAAIPQKLGNKMNVSPNLRTNIKNFSCSTSCASLIICRYTGNGKTRLHVVTLGQTHAPHGRCSPDQCWPECARRVRKFTETVAQIHARRPPHPGRLCRDSSPSWLERALSGFG